MSRFLLAFSLLAAGCQCRSQSEADSGLTPPKHTAVVREPRSCDSLERCVSACDGGTASGCYDAALFLFEQRLDAGRDLTPIPGLTARACEGGDGRGCMRSRRFDDATRLLPGQCDAGNAEACELLHALARETDAGIEVTNAAAKRAHAVLEERCAAQLEWACARLGSMLTRGRLGITDVKRGVSLLEGACEAGVAGACVEATLVFSRGLNDFEPDPARAAKTSRRARELSEAVP